MDHVASMTADELELVRRERAVAMAEEAEVAVVAPRQPVPRVVQEPAATVDEDTPVYRTKFKLNELLALYDFGKDRVSKGSLERWRDTFSLAVQEQGVFVATLGGRIATLAVFWRTKNPHVNLNERVPKWHPDGNYAYIGWTWNEAGESAVRELRDHITRQYGIEFICHHDQRAKSRGRKPRESPLIVLDVASGAK